MQPTDPAPASARFPSRSATLIGIGAVVVACDQVTKALAVAKLTPGRPTSVVGDLVTLNLLRNSGAAFSLGEGFTVVLALFAAAVVVGVVAVARTVRSRWWAWGLGLVLGGAAGNLVDRIVRSPGLLRGHVVDFVSVGWWPVFNVADSCLVTGVLVLVVAVLRGEQRTGGRVDG